jgi:hypothetical protein
VLVAWVLFPLVMLALCAGCGLLVAAIRGSTAPAPLLVPLGFAYLIVVGEFAAITSATAELATPVAVGSAVAGVLAAVPRLPVRALGWPALAAAGVFAVHAAPIVLSGEPTFSGYIKLDDTATWLALADRVMEDGRSLDGLAPSSYEATLAFNLGDGYPIGAFLPFGVGGELIGRDTAWLFQPYLAFLAAMLAMALYELAGTLTRSGRWRCLIAFVASQPALLFGYYLWGGIKELAAAALLAAFAPLASVATAHGPSWRAMVPSAIIAAALIGVLTPAGAGAWLLPALILLVVLGGVRGERTRVAPAALAAGAAILAALTLPWLIGEPLLPPTSAPLDSAAAIGNLISPLSPFQAFGVWPAEDFRVHPEDPVSTAALVATVILCGLAAALLWLRRAAPAALYVASAAAGCVALVAVGSPWVDGKALATASPALLFAGLGGAVALVQRGLRTEGIVALLVIAGGVAWSNALSYREAWLAPYDKLRELERIGGIVQGMGPTLMTEYEPYGVRHFLRDGEPEGASELRRRIVPLRDGSHLAKGEFADIDRFDRSALLDYSSLVLRRSPLASRPPLPFRLVWSGEDYDVWRQDPALARPVADLPLGSETNPVARADCGALTRLASRPGVEVLAASVRPPPVSVPLGRFEHPDGWRADPSNPQLLYPEGTGTATGSFSVATEGEYAVWLGGSSRGGVEVLVDGNPAGSGPGRLDRSGQLTELGAINLEAGSHALELRYEVESLAPGSGGSIPGMGPVVISTTTATDAVVRYQDAGTVEDLCGRRLDWVAGLASRP